MGTSISPDSVMECPPPSQVTLGYFAVLDLLRQPDVCVLGLGGNHQPRGVLVQAMDDSGADFASDSLDVRAQRQQPIDQRLVRMARAGMHGETGRLVYYHQFRVLVDHGKRNVLSYHARWSGRRYGNGDYVAGPQAVGGFGH